MNPKRKDLFNSYCSPLRSETFPPYLSLDDKSPPPRRFCRRSLSADTHRTLFSPLAEPDEKPKVTTPPLFNFLRPESPSSKLFDIYQVTFLFGIEPIAIERKHINTATKCLNWEKPTNTNMRHYLALMKCAKYQFDYERKNGSLEQDLRETKNENLFATIAKHIAPCWYKCNLAQQKNTRKTKTINDHLKLLHGRDESFANQYLRDAKINFNLVDKYIYEHQLGDEERKWGILLNKAREHFLFIDKPSVSNRIA